MNQPQPQVDKLSLLMVHYRGGEIMANIKSAKKRIKVIKRKTLENKARKSALKTAEKKFFDAVAENNKELAQECFVTVQKMALRAADKNVIHKNAAARKISSLSRRLNAMA